MRRRLYQAVYSRIRPFIAGAKYIFHNPAARKLTLHAPKQTKSNSDDLGIVERIFAAYRKMKEDQKHALECYAPSSHWQVRVDRAYSYLNIGLERKDIDTFHFFLANFGTWKDYLGVEAETRIRSTDSFIKRLWLQNILYKQIKIWQWNYNDQKPISRLDHPIHGNQTGAYVDGAFVSVNATFWEIYGTLLSGIISKINHPVVAELGAGYGNCAYFTLRDIDDFTYVDFDLPETLCLAAYYLMKTYPNKKALLYGEESYSTDAHSKYDLIFMPCYEISKVGTNTIDLFINNHSLGEMTKDAVSNYVAHIANSTRYFFHMNHDRNPNIFDNNERGFLGYEYPIPKDEFTLLYRYPDIGNLLRLGFLDWSQDIFIYLYERTICDTRTARKLT